MYYVLGKPVHRGIWLFHLSVCATHFTVRLTHTVSIALPSKTDHSHVMYVKGVC